MWTRVTFSSVLATVLLVFTSLCGVVEMRAFSDPCKVAPLSNMTEIEVMSKQIKCLDHEKRALWRSLCGKDDKYNCTNHGSSSDEVIKKTLQDNSYCSHISLIVHCGELQREDRIYLKRSLEVHYKFAEQGHDGFAHGSCGEYEDVKCPIFGFCLTRESICKRIQPSWKEGSTPATSLDFRNIGWVFSGFTGFFLVQLFFHSVSCLAFARPQWLIFRSVFQKSKCLKWWKLVSLETFGKNFPASTFSGKN